MTYCLTTRVEGSVVNNGLEVPAQRNNKNKNNNNNKQSWIPEGQRHRTGNSKLVRIIKEKSKNIHFVRRVFKMLTDDADLT